MQNRSRLSVTKQGTHTTLRVRIIMTVRMIKMMMMVAVTVLAVVVILSWCLNLKTQVKYKWPNSSK